MGTQISNEEDLQLNTRTTGRLRWWQPLNGGIQLQAEWVTNRPDQFAGHAPISFWLSIPTVTELQE